MRFNLKFCGAAGEVTGSLYVVEAGPSTVLLECGQIQGSNAAEKRNRDAFPFSVEDIDAVILSHAHIDHTGRVPLLARRGYAGPVITQNATRALCAIMLPDSGYLHEKDAEWENAKRQKNGKEPVEPLFTKQDAEQCLSLFKSIRYDDWLEIAPGLAVRFHDAGHILGSSIVELTYRENGQARTLVFSGDLGYRDAPVMNTPAKLKSANCVIMESTYGDRLHRPFAETLEELAGVFAAARAGKGNIVIPAFTVGRTQDLLYLMAEHFDAWQLGDWQIFLDSPMGIEATEAYAQYRHLYGAKLFGPETHLLRLPNVHMTRSTEESMLINQKESGAIIIAGSGMCSGGRIHHHLKHNIWRPACHLVFVGYQALGTLGRRIVDGAEHIKLWGESYPVRASVHTVGGLSAHADQQDLVDWYGAFENRPPVYLVHGEPDTQAVLLSKMQEELTAPVSIAAPGQSIRI